MGDLFDPRYAACLAQAPVFFVEDHQRLAELIDKSTCGGNGQKVLALLLASPIKPGKKLAEAVGSMLHGNEEFALQENQKVAYESIMAGLKKKSKKKSVYVISGAPGTGKSVLAVNLHASATKGGLSSFYVAPNSSFRAIVKSKVAKKTHPQVADTITGSAVYNRLGQNALDLVIVDEAHRLKDKRARGYRGINQIRDIVEAAKTSVFLLDELQTIRPEDIGYARNIIAVARQLKASVHSKGPYDLKVQLRYPGSEGYLRWVEQALQLTNDAPPQGFASAFAIVDSPHQMVADMKQKVKAGYTARLLAGKA